MAARFVAASAIGGAVCYLCYLRRKTASDDLRLAAGAHVHDLLLSEITWLQIRPLHPEPAQRTPREPRVCSSSEYLMPTRAESARERQERHERAAAGLVDGGPLLQPSDGKPEKQPHKVYAGVNMSEQAQLWHSATIDRVIDTARARPVHLPATNRETTFNEIFEMVLAQGHEVYIYGGVLRDVFMYGPGLADDVDVAFSCTVAQLVGWCEERGWVKEDCKLKTDEATGEVRWDYIAIGAGKEKFSGHPLNADCAGEFTFNCMLYDLRRRVLIDATGWGVRDAVRRELRIPYDGGRVGQWSLWSTMCDRLPGMSALRFFNFRSRGFRATGATVSHNVQLVHPVFEPTPPSWKCLRFSSDGLDPVRHSWLVGRADEPLARTLNVSLKRKVLQDCSAKAAARLALYRETLVADFDATIGPGAGAAWWAKHVAPAAAVLGHPSPA